MDKDVMTARIEFEKNKYSQMYRGKIENLMHEIESEIGIELDSLNALADRIPEKEGQRVRRLVKKIRERIEMYVERELQ